MSETAPGMINTRPQSITIHLVISAEKAISRMPKTSTQRARASVFWRNFFIGQGDLEGETIRMFGVACLCQSMVDGPVGRNLKPKANVQLWLQKQRWHIALLCVSV